MVKKIIKKARKPRKNLIKSPTARVRTSYMVFIRLPYKPLAERVQSRIYEELHFNFELVEVRK